MASTLQMTQTATAAPRGRRIKKWFMARPAIARLGVVLLLLLVWEIAARFYVDKIFLSPPSIVFTQLHTVFETAGIPKALQVSAYEIIVAFLMSVAIGLVVGLAVGLNRFSHKRFMPIILFLYGPP